MTNLWKVFLGAAILYLPVMARATSVTYDYTAVVAYASGIYSSAGTTVSGIMTIDLGAVNSSQNIGTFGSFSSSWSARSLGGTANGAPTPSGLVFSSTILSGGLSYSPSAPSSYDSSSYVSGSVGTGSTTYTMSDFESSASTTYTWDLVNLNGGVASAPWGADGLPIFGNATGGATGVLFDEVNGALIGQLQYTITSLSPVTPVPLGASVWLMLGGLGAFARKKRAA